MSILPSCRRISGLSMEHAAKRRPVARDEQHFADRAPHQSGAARVIGQARHVDHIGHRLETLPRIPDRSRHRPFQQDFTGAHGPRVHRVLETHDPVGVPASIRRMSRQKEERQARRPLPACPGQGQRHRMGRVATELEPLVIPTDAVRHSPGVRPCRWRRRRNLPPARSGSPSRRGVRVRVRVSGSVMPSGQQRPNSACTSRKTSAQPVKVRLKQGPDIHFHVKVQKCCEGWVGAPSVRSRLSGTLQ